MRKHLGQTLILVMLVGVLGNGIRLLYRSSQEKAAVDQAYAALKTQCSKGTPIPAETALDPLIDVLLRDPAYGHAALKGLTAEFPSLAYHQGKNAVFYVSPDGVTDTNFGCYASDDKGRRGTGSRFPSSMRFLKVAVEGDSVLVEFEIPKTEQKPMEHDGFSFEPGGAYVTRMDVAALLKPDEPATKIYKEFFPKAKKK